MQSFTLQVAVDPRAVFAAIWHRLTCDSDITQHEAVLARLEQALSETAASSELSEPLFELEVTHTCVASGCGNGHCDLCRENPSRACTQALSSRTLVETELRAQCGARVEVTVLPRANAMSGLAGLPPYRLQVCFDSNHIQDNIYASFHTFLNAEAAVAFPHNSNYTCVHVRMHV